MDLLPIVEKILSKRDLFLALAQKHNTPFYAYDRQELNESIERFMAAFQAHVPRFQAYYAVKLNHHPLVVKHVVEKGLGLDVASKRELSMAINAGTAKIAYFSPGENRKVLRSKCHTREGCGLVLIKLFFAAGFFILKYSLYGCCDKRFRRF